MDTDLRSSAGFISPVADIEASKKLGLQLLQKIRIQIMVNCHKKLPVGAIIINKGRS